MIEPTSFRHRRASSLQAVRTTCRDAHATAAQEPMIVSDFQLE
jgi:hypothetical protein